MDSALGIRPGNWPIIRCNPLALNVFLCYSLGHSLLTFWPKFHVYTCFRKALCLTSHSQYAWPNRRALRTNWRLNNFVYFSIVPDQKWAQIVLRPCRNFHNICLWLYQVSLCLYIIIFLAFCSGSGIHCTRRLSLVMLKHANCYWKRGLLLMRRPR